MPNIECMSYDGLDTLETLIATVKDTGVKRLNLPGYLAKYSAEFKKMDCEIYLNVTGFPSMEIDLEFCCKQAIPWYKKKYGINGINVTPSNEAVFTQNWNMLEKELEVLYKAAEEYYLPCRLLVVHPFLLADSDLDTVASIAEQSGFQDIIVGGLEVGHQSYFSDTLIDCAKIKKSTSLNVGIFGDYELEQVAILKNSKFSPLILTSTSIESV